MILCVHLFICGDAHRRHVLDACGHVFHHTEDWGHHFLVVNGADDLFFIHVLIILMSRKSELGVFYVCRLIML